MTLQRIETQLADARKQLDRAIAQRDAAISAIIKSSDKIKAAQRTLTRLEKRRRETRAEEQAARKATAKRNRCGWSGSGALENNGGGCPLGRRRPPSARAKTISNHRAHQARAGDADQGRRSREGNYIHDSRVPF